MPLEDSFSKPVALCLSPVVTEFVRLLLWLYVCQSSMLRVLWQPVFAASTWCFNYSVRPVKTQHKLSRIQGTERKVVVKHVALIPIETCGMKKG